MRFNDSLDSLTDEEVWGYIKEMSIYNDRTQGGSSIRPGSIELIQNRRLKTNDMGGVG